LQERGSDVVLELTTPSDQFGPLAVAIAWDGHTATGDFDGTHFQTTVHLDPVPLGPRSISVACIDPSGLLSIQTRSVNGLDVAPPHPPQVDYPQDRVIGDANGAVTVPMRGTASGVDPV
jgi:hypothetical protein